MGKVGLADQQIPPYSVGANHDSPAFLAVGAIIDRPLVLDIFVGEGLAPPARVGFGKVQRLRLESEPMFAPKGVETGNATGANKAATRPRRGVASVAAWF